MANKYWVGGGATTNWNATGPTNWADSSGGARNATAPTTGDAVFFNGVSNGGDGHAQDNCVLNVSISLLTLDFTGYASTLSGTGSLTITGTVLKLASGMTNSYIGAITFTNTSTCVLTSNGKSFGSAITKSGSGDLQLADNFIATGTFKLTLGTLDVNSKTISIGTFSSSNLNTRGITNCTTLTLTGNGTAFLVGSGGSFSAWPTTIDHTYSGSVACTWQASGSLSPPGTVAFKRSAGSGQLTMSAMAGGDFDFTGYTGTAVTGTCIVRGNLTLPSSLTTNSTAAFTFSGTSGVQTLSTASSTAIGVTVNLTGTSVQLQNDLTTTGTLVMTNGTLDVNSYNISVGVLSSGNSNTRGIANCITLTLTGIGTAYRVSGGGTFSDWPDEIDHNYSGTFSITWQGDVTPVMPVTTTLRRSAGSGALTLTTMNAGYVDFTGYTGTTITGDLKLSGDAIFNSSLTSSSTANITFMAAGLQQYTLSGGSPAFTMTVFNQNQAMRLGSSPTFGTPTLTQFTPPTDLTASNLAVGNPVLGAATVGQTQFLVSASSSTGPPSFGTPTLSAFFQLIASPLVVNSISFGTPDITAFFALTADALVVNSPSLGTPEIAQNHVLVAGSLTVNSPELGASDLTQINALAAVAFVIGSPSIGLPEIKILSTLVADGLFVNSSSLGTPAIAQTHVLAATAVVGGQPALGTPAVAQTHVFAASSFMGGVPLLGTPAVAQVHGLAATALAIGQPALGTPAVIQVNALAAAALAVGQPALGTPAVAQVHGLAATALAVGQPVLGTPAIAQVHELVATALKVGVPAFGVASLNQTDHLAATALRVTAPVLQNAEISPGYLLYPSALRISSPSVGAASVGVVRWDAALAMTAKRVEDEIIAQSTGAPILSKGHGVGIVARGTNAAVAAKQSGVEIIAKNRS